MAWASNAAKDDEIFHFYIKSLKYDFLFGGSLRHFLGANVVGQAIHSSAFAAVQRPENGTRTDTYQCHYYYP